MKDTLKVLAWKVSAVLALAVCSMVISCNLPIPMITEAHAEDTPPADYRIVTKADDDDLRSLETVLFGGDKLNMPGRFSNISNNPSTSSMNFPQILYHIEREEKPDGSRAHSGGTVKFSVGNSLILNDKGFFVTAYHCIENFKKETMGHQQEFLIMYGPMRNMIIKGRILSFSEKYDLALGKVDLPDDVDVEDVRITQATIKPSQVLYAKRFRNMNYIKSDLLANMLFPDSPKMGTESNPSSLFLRDPNPDWRRPLGLEVCVGYTVDLKNPAGSTITGPKPGQYFLMTGTRETVEGHSGSPIYSGNGDLAGIVVEIPQSKTLIKNAKGEAVRITYFTGPEKIRELIHHYIAACSVAEKRA